MFLCRICGRQFSSLQNNLPEQAFEPDENEVNPDQALMMRRVRGMTNLVPKNLPKDYKAAPGYYAVMIDGIVHEFSGGGQ